MKTHVLVALSLLATGFLATPATAVCTSTPDPSERCLYPDSGASDGEDETVIGTVHQCPTSASGAPQGGVLPDVDWYAEVVGFYGCHYADDWENTVVNGVGDVAHAAASGGLGVVTLFPITGPTMGLVGDLADVATSEIHDACAAATSPSFGPCGSDNAVPGPACGAPLPSIPNPFGGGGGLGGDAAENGDAAYQAACVAQSGLGGSTPNPTDVITAALTGATNLQAAVTGTATALQGQATNDSFIFANDMLGATECFIFGAGGQPSCI